MRERLVAAFVLLAVVILLGAGAARAITLNDHLREHESAHLDDDLQLITRVVAQRANAGRPVDESFLREVVPARARLVYLDPAGGRVVAEHGGYVAGDDLTARTSGQQGDFELSRAAPKARDIYVSDLQSVAALLVVLGLVAAAVGWAAARVLSRPFQRLAVAAAALGRGRFDLDLPRTRIPEARAIAEALRSSALQLETRLSRERTFAEHASHVLRTPLTALRLELESLTLDDDVSDPARAAAARGIDSVDDVNRAVGDLVALARRGSLVEGAEVPLQELATQLAQRWADRLAEDRRKLSAAAEGDLGLYFTPGPVEHVLDLVLADVVLEGRGPVRMTFHGEDDHLRVTVPAGVIGAGRGRRGRQPGAGLAEARTVVEAQGGRVRGDGVEQDLEILLPRR